MKKSVEQIEHQIRVAKISVTLQRFQVALLQRVRDSLPDFRDMKSFSSDDCDQFARELLVALDSHDAG